MPERERERRPTPDRDRKPDPGEPDRDESDPLHDVDDVIDEIVEDEPLHEPDRQ